jgi:hypothetical protein
VLDAGCASTAVPISLLLLRIRTVSD